MPSQLPNSFASAAAVDSLPEGNTNGRSNLRSEGSGDWSRARTNGAPQTFRRPSLATNISHTRDPSQPSNTPSSSGVYVPPHLNANYQPSFPRHSSTAEARYSKDQLLDLYKTYSEIGSLNRHVADVLIEGWNPGTSNASSNGAWNRRDELKDSGTGPEICWDSDGLTQPLGLIDLSEEERELFASTVNSPLKPPTQNPNKEGTPSSGINGRKSSISQMQINAANLPSGRPGPRRRETNDALSGNPLASPSSINRLSKDEAQVSTTPPLLRRRTDLKDNSAVSILAEKMKGADKQDTTLDPGSPFGSFKRTATNPMSAGLNGPSSPWSAVPSSTGFPQMGAFGNFSLGGSGQPTTPGEKKIGFGSMRGESRFKGLMSKDGSDDNSSKLRDKASVSSLERLTETESERQTAQLGSGRPTTSESNPFGEPEQLVGSAALGGDIPSPPAQHQFHPDQQRPHDEIGFSSFGPSSDRLSFRDMMSRRELAQQQTPQNHQYPGMNPHEPMSPTITNPYQSPEGDKIESDTDTSDILNVNQAAYNMHMNNARPFGMSQEGGASDRSQTSSAGAGTSRGFPNLGGLGGLGGIGASGPWSNAPGVVGTPTRANPGFGVGMKDSIFGSFGDIQSPGAFGNGPFNAPNSNHFGNVGTIGRGSKMGSLFPTAMQDQMRSGELSKSDQDFHDTRDVSFGRSPFGANVHSSGVPLRETDSPSSRQGRGMLDELFGNLESRDKGLQGVSSPFATGESNPFNSGLSGSSMQIPYSTASTNAGTPSATAPSATSFFGRSADQDSSSGISSQIPAAQQRQMVMPDRMRWIYRDPQGNTQGPWSGLEMHDWYKAGFFSPELQVKKLEDADYEPLAQLIRRIGNSREPFLVPQIGIPHGSATVQPSSNASVLGSIPATSPGVQSGSAQPPFASSFPSFGTTLTAEQQNALERRKQEEQYLMARQKEHLAQQQVMIKQIQHMQGGPHSMHSQQLHHHSSAHSLQSQPSYGSITSPSGYQPSPAQGPIQQPGSIPGFFDPQRSALPGMAPVGLGHAGPDSFHPGRDAEMAATLERLNVGRGGQSTYNIPPQNTGQQDSNHQQQVQTMFMDRARLQQEQAEFDLLQHMQQSEGQEARERVEQFQQLRAQTDQQSRDLDANKSLAYGMGGDNDRNLNLDILRRLDAEQESATASSARQVEPMSAVENVQKKVAEVKEQTPVPTQSPWASIETSLPQPFPPPQSTSPLPAPAAQRNRHNIATTLAAESRSRSQTPSVETPSAALAPWAKESLEGTRGPSLKEIQEAESRKTAQQAEIVAAARRALAEQERQSQPLPSLPTPGLPSNANWASGPSPSTPTSTGSSVWAKPPAGKQAVATPTSGAKKTLAQIQKEEEARKNRTAAVAASAASNLAGTPNLSGGKRYADLASKVASPSVNATGSGAWTTVGAGGKLKAPIAPVASPSTTPRTASGGSIAMASAAKPKPVVQPVRSITVGGSATIQNPNDEFLKWAKGALGKGLNTSINVDDFVRNLLQLPSEPEILSEAVYANSPTLDGRRFAEEFIRRRKLADKGQIPDSSSAASGNYAQSSASESKGASGGWSEVAKKGPANGAAKEEPASTFKVVAAKKKGKR